MKILFLVRLFYPHTGGVEKHVLNITQELQKRGHSITILTEKFDTSLKEYEVYKGIKIYRIPVGKGEKLKKYTIWKWIVINNKILNEADIIHAHDIFFWLLPLKLLHMRKKLYTTFHGYEGNTIPGTKEKIMHKLAQSLSSRTISVGRFYEKWYGTKSDTVIYGAVVASRHRLSRRKKEQSLEIAFVGRLEEEAGITTYIDTISLLRKMIKIKLHVYGDGSKEKEIRKKIQKEKLPIVLHGWIRDPQEKTRDVDIVFTSRYLGIIEALVEKKYVIASYNNEIKKDYLFLTPFAKKIHIVNTPYEAVDAVLAYKFSREKFQGGIDNAYEWAKKQTWEELVNKYLKLWN